MAIPLPWENGNGIADAAQPTTDDHRMRVTLVLVCCLIAAGCGSSESTTTADENGPVTRPATAPATAPQTISPRAANEQLQRDIAARKQLERTRAKLIDQAARGNR